MSCAPADKPKVPPCPRKRSKTSVGQVEVTLIPNEMKAVIFEQYGDPDVLKYTDFRVPKPGRGEALVKVHAVSLNGYDLMARAGRYKPNKGRFPHILGGDFGGELVALGP